MILNSKNKSNCDGFILLNLGKTAHDTLKEKHDFRIKTVDYNESTGMLTIVQNPDVYRITLINGDNPVSSNKYRSHLDVVEKIIEKDIFDLLNKEDFNKNSNYIIYDSINNKYSYYVYSESADKWYLNELKEGDEFYCIQDEIKYRLHLGKLLNIIDVQITSEQAIVEGKGENISVNVSPSTSEGIILKIATQSYAGLMSATDKIYLDNLNHEIVSEIRISEIDRNTRKIALYSQRGELIDEKEININNIDKTISDATNFSSTLNGMSSDFTIYTPSTLSSEIKKIYIPLATQNDNGILSSSDKKKLDELIIEDAINKIESITIEGEVQPIDSTKRVDLNTYTKETINNSLSQLEDKLELHAIDADRKYISISQKAQASGVATLDINGKVPSSLLPESVYSVVGLEKFIKTASELPQDAEINNKYYVEDEAKIYVKTEDGWISGTPIENVIYNRREPNESGHSNVVYRWDGVTLTEISEGVPLGEIDGTAYEGSKGAYNRKVINSLPNTIVNGINGPVYTSTNAKINFNINTKLTEGNYGELQQSSITINQANTTNAGLLSSEDKQKIDGIDGELEDIRNKYLPLSGGTMSGDIILNNNILISSKKIDGTPSNLITLLNSDIISISSINCNTQINSNNSDLIHYKNNNEYKIFDASNVLNLIISLNGVAQTAYNPGTAVSFNITPASIGAASSSHTHDYLPLSGGTVTGNIITNGYINPQKGIYYNNGELPSLNIGENYSNIEYNLFYINTTGIPVNDSLSSMSINDGMLKTIHWRGGGFALQIAYDIDGTGIAYRGYNPQTKTSNTPWYFLANTKWVTDAFAKFNHNHAASEITSGTLAIGRIPTGTTSSTVALGNHTHNYAGSPSPGGAANAVIDSGGTAIPIKLAYQGSSLTSTTASHLVAVSKDTSSGYRIFRDITAAETLKFIGAAASSHTHPYLPLSGGTMTGSIFFSPNTSFALKFNNIPNAIGFVWKAHDSNSNFSEIGALNSEKRIYLVPYVNGYENTWDGTKGLSIEENIIKFNDKELSTKENLDDKINDIKIGSVNLISRQMLMNWNVRGGRNDIVVKGSDADGEYLGVNQANLYAYVAGGDAYNDLFLGEGNYKENTQYVFCIEWKLAGTQTYSALILYIFYTDGSNDSVSLYKEDTTKKRVNLVTKAGKTIQKISSTYGEGTHNSLIYAIGLIEGNQIPTEIPEAVEDIQGDIKVGARNLITNRHNIITSLADYPQYTEYSSELNSKGERETTVTLIQTTTSSMSYRYVFIHTYLSEPVQSGYYVFSFDYKTNHYGGRINIEWRDPIISYGTTLDNTNDEWKRGYFICDWRNGSTQNSVLFNALPKGDVIGNYVAYRNIKLVRGNKGWDDSSAPEDIQEQLDNKSDINHTHNYLPLTGGTVTGSIISTYPLGICVEVDNGILACNRLLSGDNFWDIATRSDENNWALQFKYNGVTASVLITPNGNITSEGSISAKNGFFDTSDKRLKSNIKNIELKSKINLYEFDKNGKHSCGVIAQEIEKDYPFAVTEDKEGYKFVNYNEVLVLKCKELEEENNSLRNRLDKLEKLLMDKGII